MAYFNGFPATYQPLMPTYQPVQNQQQPGIIWVQGEAGAKSYMVAPGNTVQLWDSEDKIIYLKSADPSGMPSMKILEYKIRGESEQPVTEYATKEDLKALSDKFKSLRDELIGKRRKLMTEDEENE